MFANISGAWYNDTGTIWGCDLQNRSFLPAKLWRCPLNHLWEAPSPSGVTGLHLRPKHCPGTLDDMVASSETSDHVSLIFGKGAFKARFVLIHAGTQIWIDMVLQRANTCVPPFGRCGASGVSRVSWTRRKIDSVNIRDVGMRGKGVLWRFTSVAQMRVALLRACLADRQLHLGTNLVSREAWLSCSIINMVYRGEIWHLYDLHGVGTVEICMILYTAKMPSSSSS